MIAFSRWYKWICGAAAAFALAYFSAENSGVPAQTTWSSAIVEASASSAASSSHTRLTAPVAAFVMRILSREHVVRERIERERVAPPVHISPIVTILAASASAPGAALRAKPAHPRREHRPYDPTGPPALLQA